MPAGDVVFVLKQQKHASFERSGSDLLTTVKITLSECLLGFNRIILTHLDGRGITISSPPKKIIKPRDTIILRGEGMPFHKSPDQRGNLYVVFEVELPTQEWMQSIDKNVCSLFYPLKIDLTLTHSFPSSSS